MQPKMGKKDIDYQVIHDAFFKYQTKPKLTTHGDLYHEGKEFELQRRMKIAELKQICSRPDVVEIPGQRALALHLLASVLDKALHKYLSQSSCFYSGQ
ncbi:hypothetical protein REPUB_Repub20aG0073100 [Reevesia pubescens]